MAKALSDGKKFIQIDNVLVEEDALRIAQAVKDYDEDLDVICLDPDDPNVKLTSSPFIVVQRLKDGTYQKVLEAWELDDRILERIWSADQHKFNVLHTLESMEDKIKKDSQYRYREQMQDNNELAMAILKTKQSSFSFKNKFDDLVKVNEEGPVEKNNLKKSF